MNYYRLWQDMRIEEQWFLDDPFDEHGNEIEGWHFTNGEKYNINFRSPAFTKIRQTGMVLPVSFGGLDVPYVNQRIKNALLAVCGNKIQFIPIKIDGTNLEYYIMNLLDLVDAIDASSKIEYYTEDQVLDAPEGAGRIKYLRKLILNIEKLPKEKKIFRLAAWRGNIFVDEEIKEIIEKTETKHGASFNKIETR